LAGLRDAYSVAPSSISRVTLAGRVSGPLRKAFVAAARCQHHRPAGADAAVEAAWILEVSGGDDSALLLNCSLLVASCALNVVQAAGTVGWLTVRLSPVASVTPGGPCV